MLARGVKMFYTNKKHFKADMAAQRPHYLVAVPRLFDVIHAGVLRSELSPVPPQCAAWQELFAVDVSDWGGSIWYGAAVVSHGMQLRHWYGDIREQLKDGVKELRLSRTATIRGRAVTKKWPVPPRSYGNVSCVGTEDKCDVHAAEQGTQFPF